MTAALIVLAAAWSGFGVFLAWPTPARHRRTGLPSVRRGRALAGVRVAGA
jgi:hypothetical protein